MTIELLSMLGGGAAGFIMRFIAARAEASARITESLIQLQGVADDSADRAATRPGVWMRRIIVGSVMLAVIFFPFILSLTDTSVVVESEKEWWDLLGVFSGGWTEVKGYILLPEVRQAMLAIVGFYFGSSQVKG